MRSCWIYLPELNGMICLKGTVSEKARLNLKHTHGRSWGVFCNFFSPCLSWNQLNSLKCVLEGKVLSPLENPLTTPTATTIKVRIKQMNLHLVCIFDIQVKAWLGLGRIRILFSHGNWWQILEFYHWKKATVDPGQNYGLGVKTLKAVWQEALRFWVSISELEVMFQRLPLEVKEITQVKVLNTKFCT